MTNSFQDMAQRQVNAGNTFVANLRETFGLTAEQAEHVFRVFRKHKAVKLLAGIGRWELKHGGLWEREVIDRALSMTV